MLELCKKPNPSEDDIKNLMDLLSEHININATDEHKMTPLMNVCWKNCSSSAHKVVGVLITYGADVNLISVDRWTALHVVCRYNQSAQCIDIIHLLLNKKIDINAVDEKKLTALHFLARYNHSDHLLPIFEMLIDRKANILSQNKDDQTVLHRLCRHNQSDQLYQVIELLLRCNPSVNINDKAKNGLTAVHMLCRYNHSQRSVDILRLLLRSNGSRMLNPVNTKDQFGWTALHFTCRHNQSPVMVDTLKLLVQHKADFNLKAFKGGLIISPMKGANIHHTLRRTMSRSVSVTEGSTAFHFLCRHNHTDHLLEAVSIFLEQNIDVNVKDEDGRTALHLLCRFNQSKHLFDVIKSLVERNVDLDVQDGDGMTAVDYLPMNGSCQFHEIFEYLIKTKPNLSYNEGFIIQVAKFGCTHWVSYLCNKRQFDIYDSSKRNAILYLKELATSSFSLCSKCRVGEISIQTTFAQRKTIPAATFSRDDQQILLPDGIDTQFYDTKEEFPIEVPSYDQWKSLSTCWHGNAVDWNKIDQYLKSNSHEQCRHGCVWCQVSKSVLGYIKSIMNKIGQLDDRFQVEHVIEYGSFAEQTKILAPDEFDFGFVLKNFVQSEDNEHVIVYNGSDNVSVFLIPEGTPDHNRKYKAVSSSRLLYYFQKLVTFVVQDAFDWQIFSPYVSFSETCATIHFIYRGKKPPAVQVSVDITLALKLQPHFEVYKKFPDGCRVTKLNEQRQYLVPHRRESPSSWRPSYPSMERDTILAAGESVRRVIRLVKLMIALDQSDPARKEIGRKSYPSTYAIKTCMLNYLKANPDFRGKTWTLQEQLVHCIGVLRLFPVDGGQLLSFFNEQFNVQEINAGSRKTISSIISKLDRLAKQK